MNAAFNRRSRTRVHYRRSFRPSVPDVEVRIIDAWYNLCQAVSTGDSAGKGIYTTELHDLGVIRFKAQLRAAASQGGAA